MPKYFCGKNVTSHVAGSRMSHEDGTRQLCWRGPFHGNDPNFN